MKSIVEIKLISNWKTLKENATIWDKYSMKKYIPAEIEPKWQSKWAEDKINSTPNESDKPKKYILDMFPYPSGERSHVGHFKLYTASDVIARYYRLKGFNVLHPMGWDAFGLPAENYAIKTGVQPAVSTAENISNIKKQMQMVAFSYDWDREINTTDPKYYKWTQWIFIKLFEKGLAYEAEIPINWCPKDKTGLANEEVVDGKCERCDTPVENRNMRQWILKITEYADRLIEDLDGLDWPQSIIDMQRNWIGKSEGINFKYKVKDLDIEFEMFDSVPQTFMAQTFTVIAPEHPQLYDLVKGTEHEKSVIDFVNKIKEKKALNRFEVDKEVDGIFTGRYIEYKPTGENIPIWVASFVIAGYGSGVVNASAHDERDFAFAKKYNLPLKPVMFPEDQQLAEKVRKLEVCYHHEPEAILQEPEQFKGRKWGEVREDIIKFIEEKGYGKRKVQYHLRDWVFSRQRYWGEPIPLIHCSKCGIVAMPEDQLPLTLPEVESYQPTGTGESPLAAIESWVNTTCPNCGVGAKRETNTMPQWAGSCWYYLRFCDPENNNELISKDIEKYWMPVDWYLGGAEHAVLHLLYARFWHKFLYDIGVVSTKEPFQKLSSVGLVLASDGRKMSKRWGNVVAPEDIVKEYGADTLRVQECFMGPFENIIAWDSGSINGVYKFLNRVWEVINRDSIEVEDKEVSIALNKLINKVDKDIELLKLNTPIASMMEFINLSYSKNLSLNQKKSFLILLASFSPHITEELWEMLGETESVHKQTFPQFDSSMVSESEREIIVQINGKYRETVSIQSDILDDQSAVETKVKESVKTAKALENSQIKKVIYVPGKVINFVV